MALGFLKKIIGSRSRLGVDIGTASIKVAEIDSSDKGPELKNYGYLESYDYLERANAAFQTSTLHLDEENIAFYLRKLMSEAKIGRAPVMASLPSFSAFTTLIEVPQLTDEELSGSMSLHAKQYIPIPISEATLDWTRVGERTDAEGVKKLQIFLISVPNVVIENAKKIFKYADLDLAGIEIEGAGLARSLTSDKKNPALIIDIGSRSTSIIIAREGHLLFVSQTDFAGGSLTQVIANAMRLSPRRAEDLKRQRGLAGAGPEQQLSTIIEPIIDVIINESLRAKQNYENTYKSKISEVIVSGGGANLPGLIKYISGALGMMVSKAQPFDALAHTSEMNPFINELGPIFSVAIGLALKK